MPNCPHNRKFVVNILLVYMWNKFSQFLGGYIFAFSVSQNARLVTQQHLGTNYVEDKFGIGGNIRIWDQLFLILFKFVKGLFVSV